MKTLMENWNRFVNEEEQAVNERDGVPPWWPAVNRTGLFQSVDAVMKKGEFEAKELNAKGFQDKVRQLVSMLAQPGDEDKGTSKTLTQKFVNVAKSKPVLAGVAQAVAEGGFYSKDKQVQRQALKAIAAILG